MHQLMNRLKTVKMDRRRLVYLILIFVTVFYAVMLFPELTELSPALNDDVFQYSLCVSLKGEIEAGGNPIDHWVPYWSMGFPVFHYYQHLPHLAVVSIYYLLFKKISMFLIYRLILYLLLVFYPLILYYSLRKMNFSRISSAGAAIFSLALSNINGYGFELNSFVWRGSGMFTQLWAMFLLPLALSSIYRTLVENKNYCRSVLLLFLLTISQVMFGMMAIMTSFLFLFISWDRAKILERIKRLAVILAFFFIIIAYFFIPMQLDSPYHAHSTYDFPEKWDSYGPRYIVTHFLNGDILDHGRLPVATVLAVLGLLFSLGRKTFKYQWAGAGFILWFLLYFGRPTWGLLIDIFPLSSALHLHRFVTMVHFFGAILAGIGLSVLYQRTKLKFNRILALGLVVLLVCPVFWDRFIFLQKNSEWLRSNNAAYMKEKTNFRAMLDHIKKASPGRTYPGRRANWGSSFKIGSTAVLFFLGPEEIPTLSWLPFSWALAGDFSENFNEYELSHYNLFNVRYILAEEGKTFPSFAREIRRSGRFRLYRVETSGYFDLVGSPIAVYGNKNSIWNLTLLWMRSPLVSKKQHISVYFDRNYHEGYRDHMLLKDRWAFWRLKDLKADDGRVAPPQEEPVNIFSVPDPLEADRYAEVSPGKVLSERAGKNTFSGRIRAAKDCFLLFKMTYHPGWHAYIDGMEKDKVILSPGFMGVKVNKGVHEVKFVYRAQKWKMPLLFLGMASLMALFLWERKRK
ncbi:MAG: YfhO family protein [bacterium]